MKKYFLRGISALMMGIGIASCHHEVENNSQYGVDVVAQKKEQFSKAFKSAFGDITSGQTWGFERTPATNITLSNEDGYIVTDDILGETIRNYDFETITEEEPIYEYSEYYQNLNGRKKVKDTSKTTVQHKFMPHFEYSFEARDIVIEAGRVFCENLASNYEDPSDNPNSKNDFDYNDIVFDAYIIERIYIRKTIASVWESKRTIVEHRTEYIDETKATDDFVTTYTEDSGWGDFLQNTEVAPYKTKQLNIRKDKNALEGITADPQIFAKVLLVAAGGTKEATILGEEVHGLFNVNVSTMVNTFDNGSGNMPSASGNVSKDPVQLTNSHTIYDLNDEFDIERKAADDYAKGDDTLYPGITTSNILFGGYKNIINIPVLVHFTDKNVYILEAETGAAPHKIAMQPVENGTNQNNKIFIAPWPCENYSIDLAYHDFNKTGSSQKVATWTALDASYTYQDAKTTTNEMQGTSYVIPAKGSTASTTIATLYDNSKDKDNEGGYDISRGMKFDNNADIVGMLNEGDIIKVTGSVINAEKSIALDETKNWIVYLCDGNSNNLAEEKGYNSDNVTANFTISKSILTKLKNSTSGQNAFILNGDNLKVSTVSIVRTFESE